SRLRGSQGRRRAVRNRRGRAPRGAIVHALTVSHLMQSSHDRRRDVLIVFGRRGSTDSGPPRDSPTQLRSQDDATMPLQIFLDKPPAKQVYQTGIRLLGRYRYEVGMRKFAVANDPVNPTALGTSGAPPCQIIVVHKAPGHGALGHYAAYPDPLEIVGGVKG